eukprot:scaffold264158_cov33-Prasinocladus_malaysianus.AAC.8
MEPCPPQRQATRWDNCLHTILPAHTKCMDFLSLSGDGQLLAGTTRQANVSSHRTSSHRDCQCLRLG